MENLPPDLAEFAVADAIVALTSEQIRTRETGFLQVKKLRGSSYLSGQHAYRLSAQGLRLFLRLADAHGLALRDKRGP